MNLLPILIAHIKVKATDWTVEGEGGSGAFREGEEKKEEWHARKQWTQRKEKERGGRKMEKNHMAWRSCK